MVKTMVSGYFFPNKTNPMKPSGEIHSLQRMLWDQSKLQAAVSWTQAASDSSWIGEILDNYKVVPPR